MFNKRAKPNRKGLTGLVKYWCMGQSADDVWIQPFSRVIVLLEYKHIMGHVID